MFTGGGGEEKEDGVKAFKSRRWLYRDQLPRNTIPG